MGEIRHAGVYGSLVVVTRWFGGTKLGTGGLVRAYGQAARLALEAAPRREVWQLTALAWEIAFDELGVVETLLAKQGPVIHEIAREFGDGAQFRVQVRRSCAPGLRADLVEATRGRIRISETT
jgi:putative IMPACT (imprinted ancient) family translation regulator